MAGAFLLCNHAYHVTSMRQAGSRLGAAGDVASVCVRLLQHSTDSCIMLT